MDLIYIAKQGEPVLKIHPDALKQHEKLGWKVADADLVAKVEKDEPKKASGAAK